jgi:glycosyltransferase involved in cell wall biosynthesis
MNPIALVMIVRNEARCLARCLGSARAHVDEMLVVDTGSTDDTVSIAERYGARVARFGWVDDFAAARNAALGQVEAPWRLVLDADEWIASDALALAELRNANPDFIGSVRVESLVQDEHAVRQSAPSWLPRVLPRGVRYVGRIHEQPAGALPRRRLALTVTHDGYLPEQSAAKRGRNRQLLQTALADDPSDAYLHYQLGKDFEVHGEHDRSLPCYERATRLLAASADEPAAWRHDLILRQAYTLKKCRRFDDALALIHRESLAWPDSPDLPFTLGDVLLDAALAQPARAGEWLPQIEQAWLRAIAIGERPDMPDSLLGRGSFLAAHNLAAFHGSLGQAEQAAHWRERAALWRAEADAAGAR